MVHPSARVLILTLISIVLVNYAHTNMLGLKTWRRTAEQAAQNYQKCMSVLERFRGDTEKLFGQWQRGREYRDQVYRQGSDPHVPSFGVNGSAAANAAHRRDLQRF